MSLEWFYDSYPASPDLRQQVIDEQERQRNYDDPLMFLADTMTKMCAMEIKGISDALDLEPTPEAGFELFLQTQKQSSALIYGHVIRGLHEAVQQSAFEHNVLLTRLNNSLTGTPMSSWQQPKWMEDEVEELTIQKRREMKKAIDEDPTYTIFFENPEYMPDNLRRFLQDFNLLNNTHLPTFTKEWKKRAEFVVKAHAEGQTMEENVPAKPLNSLARDQISELLKGF